MRRAMSARGRESESVPVADDCPECGSAETVTSVFAATYADDLVQLSAWCEDCGHGFPAGDLAEDVERGDGVATDGGRDLARDERAREPITADPYPTGPERREATRRCGECGDEVDPDRLVATPAGLLCPACADAVAEEVRGGSGR